MPFIVLIIGALIVVAAIRDRQSDLFSALAQDIPAFVTWAAAIIALGAIGFVPNLKPVSRGLLALVLIVLILRNYQAIITGFSDAVKPPIKQTKNADGSLTFGSLMPSNAASIMGNVNSQIATFSSNIGIA